VRLKPVRPAEVVRWTAILAAELNVGIHAFLTPMHLREMPYIGALFIVGNAAFTAGAIVLLGSRRRRFGWALIGATSALELAGFVASRTIGLPGGYKEGWALTSENVLGMVCVVAETVVLALAIVAARARRVGLTSQRPPRRPVLKPALLMLVAVPVLVTACAAGVSSKTNPMAGMYMAPGTSMADMSQSPAPSASAVNTPGAPSASARMVCAPETQKNVAQLLGLAAPPPSTTSWIDAVYTCTYHSSAGALVLSVKQSSDAAAARQYFDTARLAVGAAHPLSGLTGLGLPAYEAPNGAVIFLKDNMTLQVDASAMSAAADSPHPTPPDLAYTVATDVLACWNGD